VLPPVDPLPLAPADPVAPPPVPVLLDPLVPELVPPLVELLSLEPPLGVLLWSKVVAGGIVLLVAGGRVEGVLCAKAAPLTNSAAAAADDRRSFIRVILQWLFTGQHDPANARSDRHRRSCRPGSALGTVS
jgi:hypothetical protein